MKRPRRRLRAIAAALLMPAGLASSMLNPGHGLAASRYSTTSIKIADGVTLLKVTDNQGPNRIRVLRIVPSKVVTIDVGLAGKIWPKYAPTSSIASAYGAIGAINGDFNGGTGHPQHPFLEDGLVATSGVNDGWSYGINFDETANYIGSPKIVSTALDETHGSSKPVDRWNAGKPAAGELAAYTTQGGTTEKPPTDVCYARLNPTAAPLWTSDRSAIEREYKVGKRICQFDALLPTDPGQVVLASNNRTGTKAEWLKGLPVNGPVKLSWAVNGWPDMLDIQGGMPLLVENGDVVAPAECGSYFCDKNPRTGVGYDVDTNRVYFITVDGRQSTSVGMNLPQFARQFIRYGSDWALNLDGGGSTTMVAKIPGSGLEVVNKPSAGAERSIPSAMLVLPGPDDGEPGSLGGGSGTLASLAGIAPETDFAVSDAEGQSALVSAIEDPGSTGGLAAALASGGLGFEGQLDQTLLAIAERYAAAREAAHLPA